MAAIKAICSTVKPARVRRIGINPQSMASFMLLTMPAWLTENKVSFFQLVNQKISRNDGFDVELGASSDECCVDARDSCFVWAYVSRTKKADKIKPDKAKAIPGRNGTGRSPCVAAKYPVASA